MSILNKIDTLELSSHNFKEVRSLGEGGFGTTVLVELPNSDRAVLKRLKKSAIEAHGNAAVELFQKESQYLEQLGGHPQVPALIAQGVDADGPWILQEYIPGENLEQILAKQTVFTGQEIQLLLKSVLSVLHEIHSKNAIHRDVKPANIIYHDGLYYLVDFGASKRVSETVLRKTGTTIGSASYAAPEQVIGHATFSSDIYSLGVTVIHLLTAMDPMDLIDRMNAGKWVWRDYLTSPVSEGLGLILDKMLEYGVHRRYGSAQQALNALEKIDRRTIARSRVENIGKIRKKRIAFFVGKRILVGAAIGLIGWGAFTAVPLVVKDIGSKIDDVFSGPPPVVSSAPQDNGSIVHTAINLVQVILVLMIIVSIVHASYQAVLNDSDSSELLPQFGMCLMFILFALLFGAMKPELISALEILQNEAGLVK